MYFGKPQSNNENEGKTGSNLTGVNTTDSNPYNIPVKHKVKSGENLSDLSKMYDVSESEIIAANSHEGGAWHKYDRSKKWLYVGEELVIPVSTPLEVEPNIYNKWLMEEAQMAGGTVPSSNSNLYANSYVPGIDSYGTYIPEISWKTVCQRKLSAEELKEVKVYIFYVEDFVSQTTKLMIDEAEKYGRDRVAIARLTDVYQFASDWRGMDGEPELVVINSHGKNQSMVMGEGDDMDQMTATGNGETNINGTPVKNVQSLPQPKADLSGTLLYLNTCHSNDTKPEAHGKQGALKGSKQTIAQVFASHFDFKAVRGTKDSVGYIHELNSGWWLGIDDSWEVGDPYPEDGKWDYISKQKDGSLMTVTVEVP
mgnify:CR=1 FL=1